MEEEDSQIYSSFCISGPVLHSLYSVLPFSIETCLYCIVSFSATNEKEDTGISDST